ncbi:hypothetical protein UPYG_G00050870 [Umbra pygmaea]|uniref:AIG1-type G domain-containing protein n=1 Tax=Umbra pygmaea TaxID=75934 RepID=A0ABD0XAI8_UMBPY
MHDIWLFLEEPDHFSASCPVVDQTAKHTVMACKGLSKVKDTRLLIRDGNPAVYGIKTNKKNLDLKNQLIKITFGKRDPTKDNKTILIVGETGTGKSTLINAMVNYVLGVKRKDKVWFEIVKTENTQTESQTTAVTVYEVFGYEGLRVPYSLTLIDTPGYGDTRGIQEDKLIAEKLYELFRSENGIHNIDAVCLVVKASMNRLSERQQYIFDAVVSIFGKDMDKSIVALITHSDGMPPKNALQAIIKAKIPCAKNRKGQPVHFVFNNRQSECIEEECESRQRNAWKQGFKALKMFFSTLNQMEKKSVMMTEGVLRQRKHLESLVSNLQDRIKEIELKQKEIKGTQIALEKHTKDMEENKDFSYKVEEVYKEKVPIEASSIWPLNKGATICTICEENCHYPDCWWVSNLSWCSAMKNEQCTVCTKKCHYTKHIKVKEIYVSKSRQVSRTFNNLKQKYEINKQAAGEKMNVLSELQKQLEDLTSMKTSHVEESFQCVIELELIALKVTSLNTARILDFLIEKMNEIGDTEKVNKLEQIKKAEKRKDSKIKGSSSTK